VDSNLACFITHLCLKIPAHSSIA